MSRAKTTTAKMAAARERMKKRIAAASREYVTHCKRVAQEKRRREA